MKNMTTLTTADGVTIVSEAYSIDIYGIETDGSGFDEEKFEDCFKGTEIEGWVDFEAVIMAIRDKKYSELPDFPASAEGITVIPGESDIWYIGYDEETEETQQAMKDITEYLFGKSIQPSRITKQFTLQGLCAVE